MYEVHETLQVSLSTFSRASRLSYMVCIRVREGWLQVPLPLLGHDVGVMTLPGVDARDHGSGVSEVRAPRGPVPQLCQRQTTVRVYSPADRARCSST